MKRILLARTVTTTNLAKIFNYTFPTPSLKLSYTHLDLLPYIFDHFLQICAAVVLLSVAEG